MARVTSTDGQTNIGHEKLVRPGTGWAALAFSSPKALLWTGVIFLIAIGWTYLFLMVTEVLSRSDAADTGTGMWVFSAFSDLITVKGFAAELLRAICGPSQEVYGSGLWSPGDIAMVLVMWLAMTLAMMVPTASPMISTYADISLTAQEKGITIVPTSVLIAGYLSAWMTFCAAATTGQWALTALDAMTPQMTLVNGYLAGAIMIVAGVYQFTPLKQVCLSKCRTPLPFFMANWTDRTIGVFKLGFRQGLFCVACCWALMLVMFAMGLMNVIWMAALAVVMALEKTLVNPRYVVQGTGAALILSGVALLATS